MDPLDGSTTVSNHSLENYKIGYLVQLSLLAIIPEESRSFMMRLIVLTVIAFCALVGVFADDADLQRRANAYIDSFIEGATNETGGFADPSALEDLKKGFEREFGLIKVKGEVKLFEGTITGLSTLQRKGNVSIMDLDDMVLLTTQLTFRKLNAHYKGAILLNEAGPQFTLNAKISGSKVSMTIVVPSKGGKGDLMSFNINKLQDIRVTIYGLGPFGWSAGFISTLVLNALEQPVAKTASLRIFEHFSKEISKYDFPAA
ncbi:hypothetical protein JTE90_021611 [Oedothorax gibbosus]|uniref:Uncharacterized protein n=1 Tax=Oedothorax gibbosus TaxID=931172 RepID=A0AAV6VRI7_9ARAC|nr:hypothetical protein JTE90_021611 [Oedothorax gibbosus]